MQALLVASLFVLPCARCAFQLPNADFAGVTTGGAQDMASARQAIDDGDVPHPDSITAEVPFTFDVADAYGLPDIDTGTHLLELTIPTLFLSSREGGGAILIRLRPGAQVSFDEELHAATVELTFAEKPDAAPSTTKFEVVLPADLDPDAAQPCFETPGVQRGVLLLNTALVLKNACKDSYGRWDYWGDYVPRNRERARQRLTEFLPYFDALAAGLGDQPAPESRSLSQERAVVERLLENLAE